MDHKNLIVVQSLRPLVFLVCMVTFASSAAALSFFHNLSDSEKIALINSSLVLYLEEPHNSISPLRLSSLRRNEQEIVSGPSDFQVNFIRWMKEDQKYNEQDMRDFVGGKPVCGSRNCTTLPSLSQTCCPFG